MAKTFDLTLAIPMYNSLDSLPNLLRSLESQTVLPNEIIFLDDASLDNSRNLAEDFLRKHPDLNVRIYTNEQNLGIAGTYNRLVLLATGEWIQILDADDHFIGNFYGPVKRHMADGGVVAIAAGMRSNVKTISWINRLFARFIPATLPRYLPMLGSFATRSGIVYSASLLKKHNFTDPIFDGSDLLHFFDFRGLGICIYEPKAVLYYNVHAGAFSSKQADKKYLEELKKRSNIPLIYRLDYFLRKQVFGFLRLS